MDILRNAKNNVEQLYTRTPHSSGALATYGFFGKVQSNPENFKRFIEKINLRKEKLQNPYKIVSNFQNFPIQNICNFRTFLLAYL